MKIKFLFIAIFAGLSILAFASVAEAAKLFLAPPSSEIAIGEELTIDLKIDSEGEALNAAQAALRFPKDTFEVVSLDETDSAFSFWLEEPNFSNTDAVISFIGGTPYGVSGSSIQILRIVFTAKAGGSGIIAISDAAITASDGSGTNILSKTVDAAFAVLAEKETPLVPVVPEPTQEIISEPTPIIREPAPTGDLPVKPELNVPLYPDEAKWSNLVSQFNVSWDLPLDVAGVSAALNKNPNFIPAKYSEGLFNNKDFASVQDGIWYIHIRFMNNIGWGPTAHYKIGVDTQAPLGFEVNVLEGQKTDNPALTLQFKTSDALSGIKEYQVRVGDGDLIQILANDFTDSFKLPIQEPGKRRILVRAVDYAENSIENSLDIEILPIDSPIISFITNQLFSGEEIGLTVKGAALPDIDVLLKVQRALKKARGETIAETAVRSDEKGNWEFIFDQPLRNGRYVLFAQSRDERGALSFAVESPEILVKSKPVIQIWKFQLGMSGALIFLLVIMAVGFGGGVWLYKKQQNRLASRILVVKTDMAKVFNLIQDDIEKLHRAIETPTQADDEFMKKRLRENIKKMEAYLKKGIEKLK